MLSSGASCSDCRLEFVQKKWRKLLLKWVIAINPDYLGKKINRCVYENLRSAGQGDLSFKCLSDIMKKYKEDVCDDGIEKALLCSEDMEPFIKYKYPMLRLRYLAEEQDEPRKLYFMTSILLYHCCVKSRGGVVHDDLYRRMNKQEQEVVVKFCERLNEMETTINNVELAIREAYAFPSRTENTTSSNEPSSFKFFKGKKSSDTLAHMSSGSTLKSSFATLQSDVSTIGNSLALISSAKAPSMKFPSSVTVLPSVLTDDVISDSSTEVKSEKVADQGIYVDSDQIDTYAVETLQTELNATKEDSISGRDDEIAQKNAAKDKNLKESEYKKMPVAGSIASKKDWGQSECACSVSGPCCGEGPKTGMEIGSCTQNKASRHSKLAKLRRTRKIIAMVVAIGLFMVLITLLTSVVSFLKGKKNPPKVYLRVESLMDERPRFQDGWKCSKNLCQKVYQPANEKIYPSYSRCILQCTGPHLWPHPIGNADFSSKVIALATNKLEYKLKTVTSEFLQRYLAEALKLFIGDLAKLENLGKRFKTRKLDLDFKKMYIQIDVESDGDPRMRLNTEEAYRLKVETTENQVLIKILSSSFCGIRHGLETLTQIILLDESTGYLITVTNADVKDAPSYKYRGLMIDTGRNYIPVEDLMRTIDGMATVKLNTFHWRISDVTSFPLLLPKLPQLFEYGAYLRSMIYTKNDVATIVKRAGVRGIRVLLEVAVPGPVGKAWSWNSGASCPSKNNNTCGDVLCTILDTSDSVVNVLQELYEEILEMTQVDDIFHMSNGLFSLTNCYNLMNHRDGFLDKALDSLKRANKGFLPKLPIVWYTKQLNKDFESKTWERFGVQLNEWKANTCDNFLAKFRVIHSSRWELSCEMNKQRCKRYRSWQEMYAWKSWRKLETFTVEGGEAILWTDLVNAGNLDDHLWPRAAAVAERLWSDIIANGTADESVYVRLNSHRTRMLHAGIKVNPIWPAWCSSNPGPCLEKVIA